MGGKQLFSFTFEYVWQLVPEEDELGEPVDAVRLPRPRLLDLDEVDPLGVALVVDALQGLKKLVGLPRLAIV